MPQTVTALAVQVKGAKANLNALPSASLFVLGISGSYTLTGATRFPAPGTVFSAVPQLGLPVLSGRPS